MYVGKLGSKAGSCGLCSPCRLHFRRKDSQIIKRLYSSVSGINGKNLTGAMVGMPCLCQASVSNVSFFAD